MTAKVFLRTQDAPSVMPDVAVQLERAHYASCGSEHGQFLVIWSNGDFNVWIWTPSGAYERLC